MRYRYVDELGITYYVAPIEGAADGTPLYAVYDGVCDDGGAGQ